MERKERGELIEEFGKKGDIILIKKIKTLEGCYSPVRKLFGLTRKHKLYTNVSTNFQLVVYKGEKKRYFSSIINDIEKIENNLYRVTTCTSVYEIKLISKK